MRTFLVAVVAPTEEDVTEFLLASALCPSKGGHDGAVDCWWIAEDDRHDRSDCDSAIFVPRGSKRDMSNLIDQHCENKQDEWDEFGYPYAETDVSGVWYLPPDVRAALRSPIPAPVAPAVDPVQEWWDRRPDGIVAAQVDLADGASTTLVADEEPVSPCFYHARTDALGVLCVGELSSAAQGGQDVWTAEDVAELADWYPDSIYFAVP